MAGKKLVIVESPAKARTIAGYLGPEFTVKASVGHVRDLPTPSELPPSKKKGPLGKFAVDIEKDFKPYYVINADKKKTVTDLRKALKDADELYLATDEDREGEAIAWHLLEVLKPKVPVKRMVFHEITKEAIQNALDNTREINLNLVDAQETRRILDRLVGYEVSPLLWRKISAGLSAGRVQSVATRMIVDRERERMGHVSAQYWDVATQLWSTTAFEAAVSHVNGKRIAVGRDFDDAGELKKPAEVVALDADSAHALEEGIKKLGDADARVESVEQKPYRRRPAAPFTTSTLQQEAGRKLRWNARNAMRIAQSLYENGYITYMRTDSTALSTQALRAARAQAKEMFGERNVSKSARIYAKKAKGAQEAHEAIRPAGDSFRSPDQVATELNKDQLALYTLIWKRTLASQMTDAEGTTDTLRIGMDVQTASVGELQAGTHHVVASVSGTVIEHRGFLAAYEEGRDAQRYGSRNDNEQRLPKLVEGEVVDVRGATATGHQTTPPPRYTEASLVKTMEERGIGRPSTYAATISTIVDRGYVSKRGQALVPTFLAFSVTRLLEENLANLVDYDFTARMEQDLDHIAMGDQDRVAWLRSFYNGLGDDAPKVSTDGKGLAHQVESLGDIDARAVNSIEIGDGMTLRVGRYGPYLERVQDDKKANVPVSTAPDEMTVELAHELFRKAELDGRVLGQDPQTGRDIVVKDGRYGPYVMEVIPEEPAEADAKETASAGNEEEEKDTKTAAKADKTGKKTASKKKAGAKKAKKVKPRTASLFKSMDLETVTIGDALKLLSLPREVGTDPKTEEVVTAQNGPYGPYLKRGKESRSLESEEQIFAITLEQALEVLAQPKRRGRGAAKPPLREFGEDPTSGKKVVIKDGRFGPYITDGKTNVTVPRSEAIEHITEDRAFELLADKRAKGPVKRKSTRKTTKKTTGRKTGSKKTASAKKTASTKTGSAKKTTRTTTAAKASTAKKK
ncbi:type I DNA topoisomerase [Gleimia hominis]|uniref:type I DNA topoisomerase n=1 Tax=Gleimia hominis TaxID=595468 RepID=UPI000C7FEC75|nr:type I DNA topoisomerase [Gleimia hominis]WIK64375.1 type I DNA topoisomerase [Gleimia hominis]